MNEKLSLEKVTDIEQPRTLFTTDRYAGDFIRQITKVSNL